MTTKLPTPHLRLAVADCLRERDTAKRRLDHILARLWREPAEAVIEAYDAMIFGSLDTRHPEGSGANGLAAERMRKLRRPLPKRNKHGLRLAEVAARLDMDREAMARLMQRHGMLELVPFGGRQSRRLVTDAAFREGLGHNADPGSIRSPRLDGHRRAAVFPVFYPDALPTIMDRLGWGSIQEAARGISDKRGRMRWLLDNHGDLPDETLATLGGYNVRGVKKARARGKLGLKVQLAPLSAARPG